MNKDWALNDMQRRIRRLPLKSGNQMNVLSCMALYSNHDGSNCFPAIDTIAEGTRLARRVVQIEMRRLEDAGWITCIDNHHGGKGKPRVYRLNIPAGKGQQMKLEIEPKKQPKKTTKKGASSNTLSGEQKGAESEAQRVLTKAPKGAEPGVYIYSDPYYPIGSLPGEPEPTGNIPYECSEIPVEDLPTISFAQHVAIELCLPQEHGLINVIAGALDFCVKYEGKTKSSATEYLIALARDEITRGGAPTRFWFTDRKWRKTNGNGKQHQSGNDKAETSAAVAAGVDKFLRRKNAMGNPDVPAAVATGTGHTS